MPTVRLRQHKTPLSCRVFFHKAKLGRRSRLVFAAVAATSGCGDEDQGFEALGSTHHFHVRDSAGIEVVHNVAPSLDESRGWSIHPEPELEIGPAEGGAAYEFSQIWSATRLTDGRIVVSDGQSYEIRVYGPTGAHLGTFGGRGGGPGEFGGPPWVATIDADTIIAWDPGHYRLSWFAAEGMLLADTSLVSVIRDLGITRLVDGLVWILAHDGSLLSTGPAPGRKRTKDGLEQHERRVVLIANRGEAVHEFGHYPLSENVTTLRADGARIGIGNPWFATSVFALSNNRSVAVARGDRWEIELYDTDGSLQRLLRAQIPRLAVTNEAVEAERDRMPEIAEAMGIPLGQAQDAFDHIRIPDSIPAIASIQWDRAGNLWVGRRRKERRRIPVYDVFDVSGRWVTSVTIPAEVTSILEIGEGNIITSHTDELDVPRLRVYRILKPY